jgi:ubiquinone/menaquinone biosynthesis C-methylase UbiE
MLAIQLEAATKLKDKLASRMKSSFTGCLAGLSLLYGPMHTSATTEILAPHITKSTQEYYDEYSETYDRLDGSSLTKFLGIDEMRKSAGSYVYGDVLEVAIGTGLQSKFYDWDLIQSFTGIDLSDGMLQEASKRVFMEAEVHSANPVIIELANMNAENLNFKDDKFDTAIDTFSMCVVADPGKVVKEMSRVVKPGGRVILL